MEVWPLFDREDRGVALKRVHALHATELLCEWKSEGGGTHHALVQKLLGGRWASESAL